MILFDVLSRHGENVCYRCRKVISSSEELSIEHKKPWQNVDTALFWDLGNIAFSHLSCNIRHAALGNKKGLGKSPTNKKLLPPGQSWCSGCKTPKPLSDFNKNASKPRGVCTECKDCQHKVPSHNGSAPASKAVCR